METLLKNFLIHLMDYTHRARGPFLKDATLKIGSRIMLISIVLLLLVSKAIKINGGEYFGIKADIATGNIIFISIIIVVLIYLSIEYYFALNYDIDSWRRVNSLDNQKSRELLKLLGDEKSKSLNGFVNFINGDSDLKNLSKALDNLIKINQYDNELLEVMEKNYKKISRTFNFRVCSGYLPLIIFLVVLLITAYDMFIK